MAIIPPPTTQKGELVFTTTAMMGWASINGKKMQFGLKQNEVKKEQL